MRLIGPGAMGRHRIRKKLTAWGVAAAVIAGMSVGFIASSAPAHASVSGTLHKIPQGIYGAPSTAQSKAGVVVLCSDKTGFTCAGGGYNGTSAQIGGHGWTASEFWIYGTPGPNGTRHNCTTYAGYRLQQNGVAYPGKLGYAKQWPGYAQRYRIAVDQTPAVGSIAEWNAGSDGHVAYVEAVTATYIITSSDSAQLTATQFGTDRLRIPRTSAYMPDNFIHFKASAPPSPTPPPGVYHTGKQVSIVSQATTGVSGHSGPTNVGTAVGPNYARNAPIWIVCYVTGQRIQGPYGTEAIWDLSDNGWYYSDAWLWTGTNGPAVSPCALKTVTVVSQATTGVSGHAGPGNQYAAGKNYGKGAPFTIACYVNGQSITGPYGTENIWDLAVGGLYYSDAWLWTGTNGPAVPHC